MQELGVFGQERLLEFFGRGAFQLRHELSMTLFEGMRLRPMMIGVQCGKYFLVVPIRLEPGFVIMVERMAVSALGNGVSQLSKLLVALTTGHHGLPRTGYRPPPC